MSQPETNGGSPTTWERIISDPLFETGYRTAWHGKRFNYELTTNSFGYERGRCFAIWEKLKGRPYRRHIVHPPTPLAPNGVRDDIIKAVLQAVVAKAVK